MNEQYFFRIPANSFTGRKAAADACRMEHYEEWPACLLAKDPVVNPPLQAPVPQIIQSKVTL